MGFFKKLTKGLGKVAKLAKVTAPIWSSFIPGGSIATSLISGAAGAGKLGKVVRAARTGISAAQQLQAHKSAPKGYPGLPSWDNRQVVQQSPNGTRGRVGRVHARAIARMRATRRRSPGLQTAATYRRSAALRRPAVYKGRMRAYAV